MNMLKINLQQLLYIFFINSRPINWHQSFFELHVFYMQNILQIFYRKQFLNLINYTNYFN